MSAVESAPFIMNEKIDRIDRKLAKVLEELAVLRAHDAMLHQEIAEIRYGLWPFAKPMPARPEIKRLYVALDDAMEAIAGLENVDPARWGKP